MTREELEAYLLQKEQEKGLQPGEFAKGIWGQESQYSTDPRLPGVELSRGRGRAVGPFQVVPYYHPDFPAEGDLQEQADFAINLYSKGGDTPEARMARYYGTGKPPPGHPTTDQYIAQTKARYAGPPVPGQAAQFAGRPQPAQIMQASYQPPQEAQMPGYDTFQDPYQGGYYPEEEPKPRVARSLPGVFFGEGGGSGDWLDRTANRLQEWASNPITQFSLGVLSAPRGAGLGALAHGAAAMQNSAYQESQAENDLLDLRMKREAARQKFGLDRQKLMAQEKLAKTYEAQGDTVKAAMIRAGMASQLPTYGVAPNYEVDNATGDVYAVQYASDGSIKQRKVGNLNSGAAGAPGAAAGAPGAAAGGAAAPGTEGAAAGLPGGAGAGRMPFAMQKTLPEFQQQQEAAKAAGRTQGKADTEAQMRAPAELAQLDATMKTIERMASPELAAGMDAVTGLSGNIYEAFGAPTIRPATRDYEAAMGQLTGENFLSAVGQMRGLGALSDAEGAAIRASVSDIKVGQSDEQHKRSLARLYANLARGKQRTADRAYLAPDQVKVVGAATEDEVDAFYQQLFKKAPVQRAGAAPAAGRAAGGKWDVKVER